MNLVYYFITRNLDTDKKKEVDGVLAGPAREEALNQMAAARKSTLSSTERAEQHTAVASPNPDTAQRKRRLPPKPIGWGDDETNTRNALVAHQQLSQGQ